MSIKTALSALLMGLSLTPLYSQDDWDNGGEIEDVEIEIVKDREITLPKASRNFDKIPPMRFETAAPSTDYSFADLNLPLPLLDLSVRPLKIRDETLPKLYGNYLRGGFGNFTTPYLEAYFANKRNRELTYGAHVDFINSRTGPVDDENSGSGSLQAEVFGKRFGRVVTAGGSAGYHRRQFHYYGYRPAEPPLSTDALEHNYSDIYLRASVENARENAPVDYLLRMGVNVLQDNYEAKETEFQAAFTGRYDLPNDMTVNLAGDVAVIAQSDEQLEVDTRSVVGIRPTLSFAYRGFLIEAGVNAMYENDTLGDDQSLHFYPVAEVQYPLSSGFRVFAGMEGGIEKRTYRQWAYENPFLGSNVPVFNTNKTVEFYGGITGALTSKLGFAAGLSIADYKNLYFFVNDPDDQSRFAVVYDVGNTAVININGELSYHRDDVLRLALKADYWGYGTDELDAAYHRPNYKFSALSVFRLFDKFRFEADASVLGGITAWDAETGEDVDLETAIDINLTTEYLVSDQFSAFVRFNNILASEYQLLNNYPVRGFQFMIGVTYGF